MEKLIRSSDWIEFTNLIEDYNLVHRDDKFAQSMGFDGKVAHGAYVASSFMPEEFKSIEVKFKNKIYDNTLVSTENFNGELNLKTKDRLLIEIKSKIVKYEERPNIKFSDDLFLIDYKITQEKMDKFSRLTGTSNYLPDSFLFSLCSSTISKYAAANNISGGAHISQTLYNIKPYKLGELKIGIKEAKDEIVKKRIKISGLELCFIQDDEVISLGKAGVFSLK